MLCLGRSNSLIFVFWVEQAKLLNFVQVMMSFETGQGGRSVFAFLLFGICLQLCASSFMQS
jgi:hypothetical protein